MSGKPIRPGKTSSTPDVWDAVVAGAGPAGAVAARLLAAANRRVLLVDDLDPGERKVGESLPGAARPLLRELDLLDIVEAGGHLPCYGNLSAWGSPALVSSDFIRDPSGPGWHLDRARFDADLRAAALAAGAAWHRGRVRLACCSHRTSAGRWHLRLNNSETHARWLIDATGRHAAIARSLGASRHRDDGLVALARWTEPRESDVDSRTLVESFADGWWYTALLPDRCRVVVLHIDRAHAAPILRTPGAWKAELAKTVHVGQALSGLTFAGAPHASEACGARLDSFLGDGWLAVGDAALSFDPLSSRGIFNALYCGMQAGRAVDAALAGSSQAASLYADRLESVRLAYLREHRAVYRDERRWRHRSFWQRRLSAAVSVGDQLPRRDPGYQAAEPPPRSSTQACGDGARHRSSFSPPL